MARYQPRHAFLFSEPADPARRRRVVAARLGIGLALMGGALVLASVFRTSTPVTGKDAAAVHESGKANGSAGGGRRENSLTPGKAAQGPGGSKRSAGVGAPWRATPGTGAQTPTTDPATASAPADDLVTPSGFGPMLRQLWVGADPGGAGLTAADVQATKAGTVYYAGQPTAGTYWSMSQFVPSAYALAHAGTASGRAVLAQFDQGAVFFKSPTSSWAYVGHYTAGSCPTDVPTPVLAAWGICPSVGS